MIEFMECGECIKKIGSPTLCPPCQHNRAVVSKLNSVLKEMVVVVSAIDKLAGKIVQAYVNSELEKFSKKYGDDNE